MYIQMKRWEINMILEIWVKIVNQQWLELYSIINEE